MSEYTEVTIWSAFFAGLISFLSPCIFPLVPAYLAQLTGTTISNNQIQANSSMILSRSIGFIIGFTIIFLLLGASSSFIGNLFLNYRVFLERIGGIIIAIFGLQMAGIISLKILLSEKRLNYTPKKSSSFFGSIMFGFLFATGWSPCVGLTLSAILILAGQTESMAMGMFMLLIYSFGMGIPFIIVALLWSKSLNKMRKLNKWIPKIQKISGYVMVFLGILLFTGHFQLISTYLQKFVPFNI